MSPAFPSPCGFLTTFRGAFPKGIPPNQLPPADYSFKVVFRDFRDIHSVPVKRELCSSWNIRAQCSSRNITVGPASTPPAPQQVYNPKSVPHAHRIRLSD